MLLSYHHNVIFVKKYPCIHHSIYYYMNSSPAALYLDHISIISIFILFYVLYCIEVFLSVLLSAHSYCIIVIKSTMYCNYYD